MDAPAGRIHLMYHELDVPGRAPAEAGEGYLRYVVPIARFREHLALLRERGLPGLSVTAGLGRPDPGVVITFDDGCESDLLGAAPALEEAGCCATFYVVAGFVGRPGYLGPGQLRELSDAGFEIGSHSMTHRRLTELAAAPLGAELMESRQRLQDLTGRDVVHFSCPHGRWSARVARTARDAGYLSVATSRVGRNLPGADWFRLARVPVVRHASLADFDWLLQGRPLLALQARQALLDGAKSLLGGSIYSRVRDTFLNARQSGR